MDLPEKTKGSTRNDMLCLKQRNVNSKLKLGRLYIEYGSSSPAGYEYLGHRAKTPQKKPFVQDVSEHETQSFSFHFLSSEF